jgi:hypothetical protein
MTVTLELPPSVERAYLAEAQARGLPLETVVREVVIAGRPLEMGEKELMGLTGQGAGLFGSPEDSALLDEVVSIAYEERRRPAKS